MNFDYKILEEKIQKLPVEMQRALTSPETIEAVKKIGEKYSLKLDQEAVLFDNVAYLMLNLIKPDDLVRTISSEANVDEKTTRAIANDINSEIFEKVKAEMRINEERVLVLDEQPIENTNIDKAPVESKIDRQSISDIERVGGFSVEKGKEDRQGPEVKPLDRGQLLQSLENPQHHTANPPANLPTSQGGTSVSPHSEPIVDYLLENPLGQGAHKSVVQTPVAPVVNKSATPTNTVAVAEKVQSPKQETPKGPDPYRELVK